MLCYPHIHARARECPAPATLLFFFHSSSKTKTAQADKTRRILFFSPSYFRQCSYIVYNGTIASPLCCQNGYPFAQSIEKNRDPLYYWIMIDTMRFALLGCYICSRRRAHPRYRAASGQIWGIFFYILSVIPPAGWSEKRKKPCWDLPWQLNNNFYMALSSTWWSSTRPLFLYFSHPWIPWSFYNLVN